ncbi:MAG: hypothetical protein JWN08_528 [Frankiales bacterium]|nr:hypothetical protein [Frankiales bacterium]
MTGQAPPYDKTLSTFAPLAALPTEESDRHYREVHAPFARRFLREMDQVVSYHTARATAELDLGGGWRQRPRAYRYIAMRFLPGRSLDLPEELHERIVQDHRSCLRDLRSFRVREQVLLDRLSGQTGLSKHVVELERRPATTPDEGDRHLDQQIEVLAEQAEGAFGLRQVLVDRVLGEAETEPVDEPGQRPLRRLLPSTAAQAFVEVYADHADWAEQWLARPAVRAVVQDPWWGVARCYRVSEECGLDKR